MAEKERVEIKKKEDKRAKNNEEESTKKKRERKKRTIEKRKKKSRKKGNKRENKKKNKKENINEYIRDTGLFFKGNKGVSSVINIIYTLIEDEKVKAVVKRVTDCYLRDIFKITEISCEEPSHEDYQRFIRLYEFLHRYFTRESVYDILDMLIIIIYDQTILQKIVEKQEAGQQDG